MVTVTLSQYTDGDLRKMFEVQVGGVPVMAPTPDKKRAQAVLDQAWAGVTRGELREWDGDTGRLKTVTCKF